MTILVFVLISLHGLIHLLGFLKAFRLAKAGQFTQDISKPAGALWLLCAVMFTLAGALFLLRAPAWCWVAAPAVLISQALIFTSWTDARFGSLANLVLLVVLIPALAQTLPGSFPSMFRAAAERGLQRIAPDSTLAEADLAALPAPVQKYMRLSGAVGKPRVRSVHAVFSGTFRRDPTSPWMKIAAEQYNFFGPPERLFLIRASQFGIPFASLHVFSTGCATMQVRVASLFQVVDARGPKMDQGETVTFFNDMCVLAPATLIAPNIRWEPVDDLTARAAFTNEGITVRAELKFNQAGELVSFSSGDRFLSADGRTYWRLPWITPLGDYREFGGRRVAGEGEAIWLTPQGPLPYGKFHLERIEYNSAPK